MHKLQVTFCYLKNTNLERCFPSFDPNIKKDGIKVTTKRSCRGSKYRQCCICMTILEIHSAHYCIVASEKSWSGKKQITFILYPI